MNKANHYNNKFLTALLNNDSFKEKITKSQLLFHPTILRKGEKVIAWNETILKKETSHIMQLFGNIPDSWEESIKEFIKTNVLVPPNSSTAPIVTLKSVDTWGRSSLNVQLFKHTTKKEYIEAWQKVKVLQDMMIEFKPKPISKKEMEIIKLKKKVKPIYKFITK